MIIGVMCSVKELKLNCFTARVPDQSGQKSDTGSSKDVPDFHTTLASPRFYTHLQLWSEREDPPGVA